MMADGEVLTGETLEAGADRVLPFDVPALDVRGRVVELGDAIDAILKRHDYPDPVARLLAQIITLTALLGSSLKFDGKFIVQAQTDGPVNLVVADFRTGGALRGYARFDAARLPADHAHTEDFGLLGNGVLALTIDQGPYMNTYQGLVPLDGTTLEEAAETYFRQSEQLPTKIRLGVAKLVEPAKNGSGLDERWRAGGIITQFLPSDGGRIVRQDLHGGDGDDGSGRPDHDDAWEEARVLTASASDSELTDTHVGAEQLLHRLFHESGARAFPAEPLKDQCACSRERVRDMLASFSDEDRKASVEDGKITVDCEFCSTHYEFVTEEL